MFPPHPSSPAPQPAPTDQRATTTESSSICRGRGVYTLIPGCMSRQRPTKSRRYSSHNPRDRHLHSLAHQPASTGQRATATESLSICRGRGTAVVYISRVLYGYPSVHGAFFSNRKSYGPNRCGFRNAEILRCGSARSNR